MSVVDRCDGNVPSGEETGMYTLVMAFLFSHKKLAIGIIILYYQWWKQDAWGEGTL